MICPACGGRTRVVECRTPQWMVAHKRNGVDPALLRELGLDPAFVRWRVCRACPERFVTLEVSMEAALAL